ncbi:MAG TPA: hypothetical protein VJ652_11325, partial [Noviherbaspirillum sp.]|nr:hypothetical protein [Noviherbaspirillum sp.]
MDAQTEQNQELEAKLLLSVLTALKKGDFSARMPSDWTGLAGKIADTLNDIIESNEQMVRSVTEVSQ